MTENAVTISEDSRTPGLLVRSSFRRSSQGREVVLVLGMHRSGTSLLANILHLLGVDMVDKPPHASSKNETGFWEREDLLAIQDEILTALGAPVGSPAHVVPFRPGWWRSVEIRPLKEKLRDVLATHLQATRRPWGFKDPRTCRLLPLWGEILEELDVSPRFIWAVRHPAESARSMTAKNPDRRPIPVPQSEVMWLAYNYDILRYTGRHWPLVVPYEAWFGDSLALAKEIAAELDLLWQGSDHELQAALAELVNVGQRHHWNERGKLHCHLALSEDVYRSILMLRAEPQSSISETLALSLQSLLAAVQPFAQQAGESKAAADEALRRTEALDATRSELAGAQARVAALEAKIARHSENERILADRSETLLQKLAAARSERDAAQAELAKLREQLDQRTQELAAATGECQQLLGESEAAQQSQDRLAADLAVLGGKLDQFRKQAVQSEAVRKNLEERLAGSEAARETLKQELKVLGEKLDAFRSKFARATEQQEAAQQARAELEGRVVALSAERQALSESIDGLKDERRSLEERLTETEAAHRDMVALLDARAAELADSRAEVQRIKSDLALLRNTLRSERERFAEAQARIPAHGTPAGP